MKLNGDHNTCPSCGEFFNSSAAFDKHRIGDFGNRDNPRRCRTTQQMTDIGMAKNSTGWWVTQLRTDI